MHFNISFTSLAVILWSGMLIISGSIWVLSSQVRKLVDVVEQQGRANLRAAEAARRMPGRPTSGVARRTVRRSAGRSIARVN